MVYLNKFVAAIKCNGQVLREQKDTVCLPFGAEFSVLLKNLDSVRIQVNVSIDGQDVAGKLVINPNSSLELERYIKNGNLESGNRFKFIERTKDVEDHRGAGIEDGLIWIEYRRELVRTPIQRYYDEWIPVPRPYRPYPYTPKWPYGPLYQCGATPRRSMRMSGASAPRSMSTSSRRPAGTRDGITVPGSRSNQKFITVSGFTTETTSEVIVIRLCGEVSGKSVSRPVTVKSRPKCQTCGLVSKLANAEFCLRCGTAVTVI